MLILKILLVVACITICTYRARREKKPVYRYPRAGDPLANYDADFITLACSIQKARTLRQLDYARRAIYQFKSSYIAYQEPIKLNQDIRKLRDQYKARRLVISISKMPMVK